MKYPKFLKEKSCIGVPAPSDGAFGEDEKEKLRYENAKKNLENLGYKVELSSHIFQSEKGRSADCKVRAEEINAMFASEKIDAILCATGGEFLVEILPYVDFEALVRHPKWVEGFSDPTGILFPITTKYDIATIYGKNFSNFGMQTYHKSLNDNLELLKGNILCQESYDRYEKERAERVTGLEGYNLNAEVEWKSLAEEEVEVEGRILAGCLDLIDILAGTKYDGTKEFIEKYKQDGIIWGFDNCDLSKEQVLRSMWKLSELGYFQHCKAILFGRFGNDIHSYLGYDVETCLKDSVLSQLSIPILYDVDISHKAPSLTIINGAIAKVHYKNGKGSICFELK